MLISSSIAAATAVTGYDLLRDKPNSTISAGQRITRCGLRGSAASGDSLIRVMAGNSMVAELYNSNTGFPTETDMMPIEYVHRGPSTRIYAIVADAPATNPLNIVLTRVP
jgi:hypothetical protein